MATMAKLRRYHGRAAQNPDMSTAYIVLGVAALGTAGYLVYKAMNPSLCDNIPSPPSKNPSQMTNDELISVFSNLDKIEEVKAAWKDCMTSLGATSRQDPMVSNCMLEKLKSCGYGPWIAELKKRIAAAK